MTIVESFWSLSPAPNYKPDCTHTKVAIAALTDLQSASWNVPDSQGEGYARLALILPVEINRN